MCGICGVVNFPDATSPSALVDAMSSELAHRGPDASGAWHNDHVALGHRRLSIIDLESSRQPMASVDGRYIIVFNGEVLNYRELRREIEYPFRTAGDTETVLAAHIFFGDSAVQKFEGQFSYCIYDREKRSLFLARDRMGILPLYWWAADGKFAFSSEMSSLLRALPKSDVLDIKAVAAYLGARSTPAPQTLLSGVRKLEPGHTLNVLPTGEVREDAFWKPELSRRYFQLSPERAVDELDRRLTSAVDRALVADVAVGSYLSGGVDSSLIAAKAAQRVGSGRLHTFCASFGDSQIDEAGFAKIVSDHIGTEHHQVDVRPDDFAALWESLSRHRGAPVSEPADVAVYRLAESARNHVKVVLSGEGSDELFAGYPKHRLAELTRAVGVVPAPARRHLLSAIERSLPGRARRLGVAFRALSEPTYADRLAGWFAPFTCAERRELLGVRTNGTAAQVHGRAPALRSMMTADLHQWLADNLLERGDRMSMAASIELRPPFLDNSVVEFSLGLPTRLLRRQGQGKWLVKQVALRTLPKEIVFRPKSGFRVPLDRWFRTGLRDFAWDLVRSQDSVTEQYLNPDAVRRLFVRHDRGVRDESIRIWTLASLEVWHRGLRAHRLST